MSLHHSSSAALALVSPLGQIRSTSTLAPSSRSGSAYTRRTLIMGFGIGCYPLTARTRHRKTNAARVSCYYLRAR